MHSESLTRTSNDRIFIFKSEDSINIKKLEREFNRLYISLNNRDLEAIFKHIKTLIPTYSRSDFISQNCFCDIKEKSEKLVLQKIN